MALVYGCRISRPCRVVLLMMCLLPSAALAAGSSGPLPARNPYTGGTVLAIHPQDRCPVCAMYPARHPRYAGGLVLADGRTFIFCSAGCLLRAWHRPQVYLNAAPAQKARLVVHDYFSGQLLDGTKALWVAGSDVIGPMGPAIVALRDHRAVAAFRRRHGGRPAVMLGQLNDAGWHRLLNGSSSTTGASPTKGTP